MSQPLVLVTGSSDGIGLETARQLAERGAEVIVHGRNLERASAAQRVVATWAKHKQPDPAIGDLSSLAGARTLAAELAQRQLHPTVLINNAGVYMTRFEKSVDGIELTMAINHFAHFVLTQELLAQPGGALERVINVSSGVHQSGRIDLDDIELVHRPFDGGGAYAASKLANVLFTVELARDSLADSARTSVLLALDAPYRTVTGEYFAYGRKANMSPRARDADFARTFFDESAERVARP
jgi:retinol dehydrogenase-12